MPEKNKFERNNKTEKETEKEKKIESFMKPLREIMACETLKSYGDDTLGTDWCIEVEWSEPDSRETSGWKKFTAGGLLNQRFLNFATKHYEYWIEKAHVPLKILKFERLGNKEPEHNFW